METCGDCRWYVQPPDLEWDWICFVLKMPPVRDVDRCVLMAGAKSEI